MGKEERITEQGEKVKVKKCPNCHDELTIKIKDGIEVFECENCKFVIENERKK